MAHVNEAVVHFAKRPSFSRTWVRQEIFAAPRISFHVADISWDLSLSNIGRVLHTLLTNREFCKDFSYSPMD
jgi:hypothetical protein